MEFQAQQLEEWSGGRWEGAFGLPVRGFCFDSRRVEPGDLFVCLRTDRRDGHDFISQAAASGAVAALVGELRPEGKLPQLVVDDPLEALGKLAAAHRRRFTGPVIGVTGSCGKTSTKDLLALLLGGAGPVHATKGNLNNLIGAPLTLLGLDPDRHRAAVIEAGINLPGEMAALASIIQPTHTIITLIAPAHLEQLVDLDGVAREKALLAKVLPHTGALVIPASCMLYEAFHDLPVPVFKAVEEGDEGVTDADVVFRVEQMPERTVLHLNRAGVRQIFTLRKVSAGMAANAVLAIEMAGFLGVSVPEIQERLLNWAPACFRGEVVEHGRTRFYVDCYNANPAAMEDALAFFKDFSGGTGNSLYVLGCMGELGAESGSYHHDLGRRIKLEGGDCILITGPADVEDLREGLLAAGNDPRQITVFSRLEEIEDKVISHDGFVFIKGSRVYGLEALLEKAAARSGRNGVC